MKTVSIEKSSPDPQDKKCEFTIFDSAGCECGKITFDSVEGSDSLFDVTINYMLYESEIHDLGALFRSYFSRRIGFGLEPGECACGCK